MPCGVCVNMSWQKMVLEALQGGLVGPQGDIVSHSPGWRARRASELHSECVQIFSRLG